MTSQFGECNISIEKLISKIKTETISNKDIYLPGIDQMCMDILIAELNQYADEKRYNTAFGDLVPIIIGNALCMNLIIIQSRDNIEEVCYIECSSKDASRNLVIYKTHDHYDAIVKRKVFETTEAVFRGNRESLSKYEAVQSMNERPNKGTVCASDVHVCHTNRSTTTVSQCVSDKRDILPINIPNTRKTSLGRCISICSWNNNGLTREKIDDNIVGSSTTIP